MRLITIGLPLVLIAFFFLYQSKKAKSKIKRNKSNQFIDCIKGVRVNRKSGNQSIYIADLYIYEEFIFVDATLSTIIRSKKTPGQTWLLCFIPNNLKVEKEQIKIKGTHNRWLNSRSTGTYEFSDLPSEKRKAIIEKIREIIHSE